VKRSIWSGVLLACAMAATCAAWAKGPGSVRKQLEASMLVTGLITIRPDGSVAAVDVDKPQRLPEGIAAFVGRNAADWRFEPVQVDGKAAQVRARMSVRLIAKPLGDGKMEVSVRSADFGDEQAQPAAERITAREMTPPGYPLSAAEKGVQGTAYLLLRVGRDGAVKEAVAEQVNLRYIASEPQMNQHRYRFARTALAAARRWTFQPPTEGDAARQTEWAVRVPVDFTFGGERRYGQWEAYVPGPRERVPWADQDDPAFSPDALVEGGVYQAHGRKGPRLLTPLDSV